ncbi:MAG TPA: FAD-dependent oxidoreductase, partial [Candidatus Dormibacteraeota bacterium]|nr:FAD-dependent oxidoreductase [Candidatus Dormibacteraeota bacterium]
MSVDVSLGREPDPFLPMAPLSPAAARAEAERCLYCHDAACTRACPTGIDVPGFIRKIATGNVEGAARTILAANPVAATCAAACPVERLCEGACVRAALDRPIAVGRLQAHAIKAYAATGSPFFIPGAELEASVAVVGAGPAVLACAAELRRAGVGVTVYDAGERAGGLGDRGIVPWRLPREAVALDAREVERSGARFLFGTMVGRDVDPAALLGEHDAIVLATGLGRAKPLGIPGETLPGVVDALDLIRAAIDRRADGPAVGRRVAVVGGGSTAFDAAAAAVRLGAEHVVLLYRRGPAECPAYPHAIELARTLGVTIRWLTAPVEVLGAGKVQALAIESMTLGEPDATGRRRPVPVPGSRSEIKVDTIVRAVGQVAPDGLEALLASLGVEVADRLLADVLGRTAHPKVWAAGDVVNGGAEVVNAVQAGKLAARSILETLAVAPGRVVPVRPTDATVPGVDLFTDMAGIRSPNPFWLASCPITNTGEM